jgi:hypothetical protein
MTDILNENRKHAIKLVKELPISSKLLCVGRAFNQWLSVMQLFRVWLKRKAVLTDWLIFSSLHNHLWMTCIHYEESLHGGENQRAFLSQRTTKQSRDKGRQTPTPTLSTFRESSRTTIYFCHIIYLSIYLSYFCVVNYQSLVKDKNHCSHKSVY